MAPIERKPLPPPNANVTPLTEGDRAEFLARANEVINHYLSGPGSYWDEGPRKPLEETLSDLRAFHSQVTASKQLADDPGRILDSVAGLVDGAIDRVGRAIEDRDNSRDDIRVPLPETNDRIIRAPTNAPTRISYRGSAPREFSAGRDGMPRVATRFLSGKTMDRMPATTPEARTASQSEMPQGAPLIGLVSGKPMSFHPVQPQIWNFPDNSTPKDDRDNWLLRLIRGVRSS